MEETTFQLYEGYYSTKVGLVQICGSPEDMQRGVDLGALTASAIRR